MKEIVGDFWSVAENYDALVVTINKIVQKDGRLVMGGGIAKDFRDKYKGLDRIFGKMTLEKSDPNIRPEYKHLLVTKMGHYIIGFPTKIDWKNPSIPSLIKEASEELTKFVDQERIKSVLMTRPGCGLGGLLWKDVKPLLNLDNRFTVINEN